jgi:predicted MFS family arabinose efflux permease
VLALVIVAGAVWNGAFGAAPSMFQTAAVRTQNTSPELAGAWVNASSNAGIAVGAALGGVVLASTGIREVAWLAAAFVVLAVVAVLLAGHSFGGQPGVTET